jgi:uncharacterized protein YgbK (DUF1537 family)
MVGVALVADDLTGAMDTAQGFAARGYRTAVVAVPGTRAGAAADRGGTGVLGVNTDTRSAAADAAARRVRTAVTSVGAETVYKKVDSTLRGNVAVEVDAALSAAGAAVGLFAPAFPAVGRTTREGVHYVDGTPVAETAYGDDPAGPRSSRVADRFGAVDRPVETVPAAVVEQGADRVAAAVQEAIAGAGRPPVVVCDGSTESDLAAVADAGRAFDALYAGSGGLAAYVGVPGAAGDGPRSLDGPPGAPLGVVGSTNETTLAQLGRVPDEDLVVLDPERLLAGTAPGDAAGVGERLRAGRPVVVTAAADRETVDRTLAAGRDRGLSADEVRARVATGLAETAAAAVRAAPVSGLVLSGGDVAVEELRALDATTVKLTGTGVETGLPVGAVADGPSAGTPVVTKAGGFGSPAAIVNCLEALGRDENR